MDRLMALVAFAFLLAFVGILMWHVQRWDLWSVIGAMLLLAAYDFVTSSGRKGKGK